MPSPKAELNPAQVAWRLQISRDWVYKLVQRGILPARRYMAPGAKRPLLFITVAAVEAFAKTWKARPHIEYAPKASRERGKIAAECFKRFAQGQSLEKIVVETELDPLAVKSLYREWTTGLMSEDTIVAERRRIREESRVERARAREDHYEHQRALKRAEGQAQIEASERAARILANEMRRRTGT